MTLKEKKGNLPVLIMTLDEKNLKRTWELNLAFQWVFGPNSCFVVQKLGHKFKVVLSWMCHTKEKGINKRKSTLQCQFQPWPKTWQTQTRQQIVHRTKAKDSQEQGEGLVCSGEYGTTDKKGTSYTPSINPQVIMQCLYVCSNGGWVL